MVRIPAPKTITVGGKTFEVKQNPTVHLREGCTGLCVRSTLTIEIDSTILPEYKTTALLHEVIEAINDIWLDDSVTHSDINRLGEALLQLLQSLGVELDW